MDKKYFVLEIITTASGTAKAVTEKSTLKESYMLFHQIMSSALANPDVTFALCQVIDSDGFCQVSERYPRLDDIPVEELV